MSKVERDEITEKILNEVKESEEKRKKKNFKIKIIVLGIVVAIVIVMLFPLSMKKSYFDKDMIAHKNVPVFLENDGEIRTKIDSKTYELSKDDDKYERIKDILLDCKYHCCFKTFIPSSKGPECDHGILIIYIDDKEIMIGTGNEISIEGRKYIVGYFDKKGSKKIFDEIVKVLEK